MSDSHNEYEFNSSIPVVRMLDEEKTRDFYTNYLGFSVDWEHRFRSNTPLYMQIRQGRSLIHLDGHADSNAPICTVRIPVHGLRRFHEKLARYQDTYGKVALERPRGTSLEMVIYDPSDNCLIFSDADKSD